MPWWGVGGSKVSSTVHERPSFILSFTFRIVVSIASPISSVSDIFSTSSSLGTWTPSLDLTLVSVPLLTTVIAQMSHAYHISSALSHNNFRHGVCSAKDVRIRIETLALIDAPRTHDKKVYMRMFREILVIKIMKKLGRFIPTSC